MTNKQCVKFGDICREVKLTTKDPLADGYELYIGLEHLDSSSLKINRWGLIREDNPSFTRVFKKGHILLGKRRCYLKKAAIAEFDGICSGDIIVMEPNEALQSKDILPFIIQSEAFWNWAIQTSSGSLSPRTKFKSLEPFTLSLPTGEKLFQIEAILKKSAIAKNIVDDLLNTSDDVRRIFLKNIFQTQSKGWISKSLGELFDVQLGKMLSKKSKKGLNPKPYLANFNVQWNRIDISEINYMDFNEREMKKFRLKKGDILVCEGGEIGRTAIWNGELEECYFQKALHRLRPLSSDSVIPEFMSLYMDYKFNISKEFGSQSMATTIAHIPREKLMALPVAFPDKIKQMNIINAINNFSLVKEQLLQRNKKLTDIQQALL